LKTAEPGHRPPIVIHQESGPSGAPVVVVEGEIDILTAAELRGALHHAIEDDGPDLVVDLRETQFLDSYGLGVLVGALRDVTDRGGEMTLRHPNPSIRQLVELTALDQVFCLED
jgi:anti-sigma B factor antagonist